MNKSIHRDTTSLSNDEKKILMEELSLLSNCESLSECNFGRVIFENEPLSNLRKKKYQDFRLMCETEIIVKNPCDDYKMIIVTSDGKEFTNKAMAELHESNISNERFYKFQLENRSWFRKLFNLEPRNWII